MPRRAQRRTEEHYRLLLQRGLELYRRRIRQRASRLIAEFLGIERLPRRLTFREVVLITQAIFERRTRVPFMYQWVERYRGRWLAKKWAWYIRKKEYWRERFMELAEMIDHYKRLYNMVVLAPKEVIAHMTAWMDSQNLVEPELCTAKGRFGELAEILTRVRRLVLYDEFMSWAANIARVWPNRLYRVVLFLSQRNRLADETSEKGGAYFRDIGFGNHKYWIHSYRVYGKQLPELVRQFEEDLEAVVLWTLDPPPVAPECMRS